LEQPWYKRIAYRLAGEASNQMLVNYGHIFAMYLIVKELTIEEFVENITANMSAFKEYLARYLKSEEGATDGKEL
jgi:hypothetical protein